MAAHLAQLGHSMVALRLEPEERAPQGALTVLCDPAGHARRGAATKVAHAAGLSVFCFHPGPYAVDLTPFAGAPELGLRLQFVIDADPRLEQQRFDLFLASEVASALTLGALGAAIEAAVRVELGQGNLALSPCTAPEEWHAFRAGLNQLCYTRFGLTIDDCIPVDLGASVDFAALLTARVPSTVAVAAPEVTLPSGRRASGPSPAEVAAADASAMRRLFLELPALTCALRLLLLPPGQELFQLHQRLLQRLDLCLAQAGTMPSLAWATPEQPLAAPQQARRAASSALALQALDGAWGALARWRLAAPVQWPALLDDADRLVSNLELALAQRHAVPGREKAPLQEPVPISGLSARREPT